MVVIFVLTAEPYQSSSYLESLTFGEVNILVLAILVCVEYSVTGISVWISPITNDVETFSYAPWLLINHLYCIVYLSLCSV